MFLKMSSFFYKRYIKIKQTCLFVHNLEQLNSDVVLIFCSYNGISVVITLFNPNHLL